MKLFLALLFTYTTILSLNGQAEIAVGTQLPSILLKDQHDQEQKISAETKYIIFAKDMDANKLVTKALEGATNKTLPDKGYAFVADISEMPTLIGKMFALPKMKKYPYLILLDRDAAATKEFPSKPKQITIMSLNNFKVEAIDYYDSAENLKKVINP